MKVRDDGVLAIAALARADAGRSAHEGVRAVGADDERRLQRASIGEEKGGAFVVDPKPLALPADHFDSGKAAPQRLLQRQVLDDPRQLRNAAVERVETQLRACVVAENRHGMNGRQPFRRQRMPRADLAQESDIAGAECVDPRIVTLGLETARRGRLRDQDDAQLSQRARQGRRDRTAADDDKVMAHRVYNAVP